MAVSAQITLRKKPNKNGLYPLAIRITKNRRSTYKHIGHYIEIEEWDDKNKSVNKHHPNSKKLNALIKTKIEQVNKELITLQTKDGDSTALQIKKDIYKPSKNTTFFELAEEHLDELEVLNKFNRLSCDSVYVGYILKFSKSKQL